MEKISICNDLITGANDRGSSKKFTMILYSILGAGMIIADMIFNHGKLDYPAFLIVVGMALGQAAISVADKKINDSPAEASQPDKIVTTVNISSQSTETAGPPDQEEAK